MALKAKHQVASNGKYSETAGASAQLMGLNFDPTVSAGRPLVPRS